MSTPGWAVCYKRAVDDDGQLLFPKKLSHAFLAQQLRVMGSFFFANQYENNIVPEGDKPFQATWLRYYEPHQTPDKVHTFCFMDLASSLEEGADYTALVVVDVDEERNWWIRYARRARITPTQQAELVFRATAIFKPMLFGIEKVGYQAALGSMVLDKARRDRIAMPPITEVERIGDKTKEMRILSLVPRFEWGWVRLVTGMNDLEMEYAQFPRAKNDDLLDALASIEDIAIYPTPERQAHRDPAPNDPNYERWYIAQKFKRTSRNSRGPQGQGSR